METKAACIIINLKISSFLCFCKNIMEKLIASCPLHYETMISKPVMLTITNEMVQSPLGALCHPKLSLININTTINDI